MRAYVDMRRTTIQFFPGGAQVRNPLVPEWGGGGALPSNRLMGMCRWMESHFHGWIDYDGVAFSIELLKWGRIFSGFGGKNICGKSG